MQCLICSSETEAFYDAKMQIESYHCEQCGLIFKDPSSHAGFHTQKQRYDLHENDAADEGYRNYFQIFLDFILPLSERSRFALDFGCGKSTLLAEMLAEQGVQTTVYDPIYHPDERYRESSYDLITSVEVFEHLHDPAAVFGMLVKLLKIGGHLAIRTESAPLTTEAYLDWYYRRDPTHIVFLMPQTVQWLCRRWGCEYVADNGKNMVLVKRIQ